MDEPDPAPGQGRTPGRGGSGPWAQSPSRTAWAARLSSGQLCKPEKQFWGERERETGKERERERQRGGDGGWETLSCVSASLGHQVPGQARSPNASSGALQERLREAFQTWQSVRLMFWGWPEMTAWWTLVGLVHWLCVAGCSRHSESGVQL